MIRKKLRLMEYAISEAFVNIGRNGVSGFAVVSTAAFTLCILWAFIMISLAASNYTSQQVDKFEIAVFMKVGADSKEALAVAEKIKKITGVADVTIKQRDKEWETFKIKHSYLEAGGLPSDVLPYSMSVKPKNSDTTISVTDQIRKIEGIDAVFERKELYNKMVTIAKLLRFISIIGAVVLFIITTYVIGNAIKLTIYSRRKEIQTMQLVGASTTFIRFPFVFEGMFFGFCGAILGFILVIVVEKLITKNVITVIRMTEVFAEPLPVSTIFWGMITCGILIGAFGSILSLNKFLENDKTSVVK